MIITPAPVMRIYQGDDYAAVVSVYDVDPAGARTPADLTGYVARAQLRHRAADGAVLAEFACTVNVSVVELALPAVETAALPCGQHEWDLQVTAPDNVVSTVYKRAPAYVDPEVTRP